MNASFETKANIILDSLGKFLDIPNLQFDDEDHTCSLQFNDDLLLNLTFEEEHQELIVHSLVGQLPEEPSREILEELLEANLFGAGTRDATLSLARESRQIILAKTISVCDSDGMLISGESLAKALVDLAEVNLHWKFFLERDAENFSKREALDAVQEMA